MVISGAFDHCLASAAGAGVQAAKASVTSTAANKRFFIMGSLQVGTAWQAKAPARRPLAGGRVSLFLFDGDGDDLVALRRVRIHARVARS